METRILEPLSAIGQLVVRDVVTVEATASLREVAKVMREANVSSVLVGSDRTIATERDLARALASGLGPDDAVADVASAHPIRVPARTPVVDGAALMLNQGVRHLVVAFPDRDAVVSLRDVMAVLLQATDPHLWLTQLRVAVEVPAEIWLG